MQLSPVRRRTQGAFRCALATACALLGLQGGRALAQSPPPAPPLPPMAQAAPAPVFAIRGFQVRGENPLGAAEAATVLAPFQRAEATIDTLQQATAALEKALRERGWGLHRVSLPPQDLGGTITLEIVRFTISRVQLEGRVRYSEENVRRTLPELQEGHTPNFRTLAVQTAIANENPNKQVQVGIRESDRPDQIEATLSVKEDKPWNVAASVSNAGTAATGRDRFTLSGTHTNLFDRDHQLVAAYTTSLQRPADVQQLGLNYKVPLYAAGGVLGLSYTRSDVIGSFGSFTSTGAGHTLGLAYTHYLPPDGGRRSFVTLGLDDKLFKAVEIDRAPVPGAVDRRSRPVSAGYSVRLDADGYSLSYDLGAAFNLGSGAGNDLDAYTREDPRIDTVRWKLLRGGLSYARGLGAAGATLTARMAGQYSPDVLISGEQFGLGGIGSVRGTSVDRPLSGDYGALGGVEVGTPEWLPGLRMLGFVDAGWLGHNKADAARGKFASDSLASAGLGVRYLRDPLAVNLDYGRILRGSRVPRTLNGAAPKVGDDRVYLNVSVRF